ncbi:unnamed protein product, partial [Trichogramma brassicae]
MSGKLSERAMMLASRSEREVESALHVHPPSWRMLRHCSIQTPVLKRSNLSSQEAVMKSAVQIPLPGDVLSAKSSRATPHSQPGAPVLYSAARERRAKARRGGRAAVVGSRCLSRGREVAPIPVRPRNCAIRRARRDLQSSSVSTVLCNREHLLELSLTPTSTSISKSSPSS